MTPDNELLCQYVENHSETAFAEVVRRHVDMVYSAAVRLVGGDRPLAEDVTQQVFTLLGAQASRLINHPTLAGWLHTSTHYAASHARRNRQRQQAHEHEAYAMQDQTTQPEIHWLQLRAELDDAVNQLKPGERDAVLLRFFEGMSNREIGAVLGLNENTARMRVERALEKLHGLFLRRGVTTTAALLAATLSTYAAPPAPAVFVAGLAGKSLAGIGVAGGAGGVFSSGAGKVLFAKKGLMQTAAVALLGGVALVFLISREKTPASNLNTSISAAQTKLSVPSVSSQNSSPTTNNMNVSQVINRGALAATALLAATATAPAQNAPANPPPSPPAVSATAATVVAPPASMPSTATTPNAIQAALVSANNQFALDLFRQFNSNPKDNAFFSPYSISTALAMTWAGANGETASQMAAALHFSNLSVNDVTMGFGALQTSLAQSEASTGTQLAVANSLWPELDPEHPFLREYMNQVRADFGSDVIAVSFKNNFEDARNQINTWVDDKTNDKIKDLLHQGDVDAGTRLVLVNAIYFKGAWASAFRPQADINDKFNLADGSTQPIVLMHQIFSQTARYADFASASVPFQMLSLNYYGDKDGVDLNAEVRSGALRGADFAARNGGDLSFVVLLPKTPDGLAALEKSLTAEQLTTWFGQLAAERVDVFLPKFKIEQHYQLADTLKKLGVVNAFIAPNPHAPNPHAADFSGMNDARDLYISKVIHQTFIDVDEKGTEAAAATAVVMAAGGAPPPPPSLVFRADHPFLFLIRDNTIGSILFLGHLTNPPAPTAAEIASVAQNPVATTARGRRGPAASAPAPARGSAPRAPAPAAEPITIIHPREAASAALDIITALRNDGTNFVGSTHPALVTNLANLETAANAVIADDGTNAATTTSSTSAFSTALSQTITTANVIANRVLGETQDDQAKARQLTTSLKALPDK